MEPDDSDIQQVTDKLDDYAETIRSGGSLHSVDDALELDVTGGRIWLHPVDDRTTVDIHLFDDTSNRNFNARSQIINHLTEKLDAPIHGKYEPYTPLISDERMHIQANLEFLQD
jgi:hypothetical protein